MGVADNDLTRALSMGGLVMSLKHILIIEDDKDILDVLTCLLESEGYQVSVAANGREGLDLLGQCSQLPDLILLDLVMPVMDGIRFRQIQSVHEEFKHIPVIMMSTDKYLEMKRDRHGVEMYMEKPLDLEMVLNSVSSQCLGVY